MPIPEGVARQAVVIPAAQLPQPFSAPLFGSRIPAGFASPAEDYVERDVDANVLLITNKRATYFAWVVGQSMHEGRLDTDAGDSWLEAPSDQARRLIKSAPAVIFKAEPDPLRARSNR